MTSPILEAGRAMKAAIETSDPMPRANGKTYSVREEDRHKDAYHVALVMADVIACHRAKTAAEAMVQLMQLSNDFDWQCEQRGVLSEAKGQGEAKGHGVAEEFERRAERNRGERLVRSIMEFLSTLAPDVDLEDYGYGYLLHVDDAEWFVGDPRHPRAPYQLPQAGRAKA